MTRYLSVTDLFLVGLAVEIVGAVLLASGLLASPRQMYRISATYLGYNSAAARDRVKNRIAAEFGVTYLIAGFSLQAIGYGAEIAGVRSRTGGARLTAAASFSAAVAAVAILAWFGLRRRRLDRLERLVTEAARDAEKESREEIASQRADRGEPPLPDN